MPSFDEIYALGAFKTLKESDHFMAVLSAERYRMDLLGASRVCLLIEAAFKRHPLIQSVFYEGDYEGYFFCGVHQEPAEALLANERDLFHDTQFLLMEQADAAHQAGNLLQAKALHRTYRQMERAQLSFSSAFAEMYSVASSLVEKALTPLPANASIYGKSLLQGKFISRGPSVSIAEQLIGPELSSLLLRSQLTKQSRPQKGLRSNRNATLSVSL